VRAELLLRGGDDGDVRSLGAPERLERDVDAGAVSSVRDAIRPFASSTGGAASTIGSPGATSERVSSPSFAPMST
jgi:hypothetical protein